ncbi:MAG: MarR family transcriptional regulator [Clostridia bacterium]|nr:MarR family transcriptional regulator [Clostridia bacterium]
MERKPEERSLPEQVRDRFMLVDRMHHCALDRNVAQTGLHRSQFFMLLHVSRCPEPPSQKELAQAMSISPAAVAVTLGKLEAAGYIQRETASGDSRRHCVRVTEKGQALLDATRRLAFGVDEVMFRGFSEEELTQLFYGLAKMQDNLRALQEGRISLPDEPTFGPPPRCRKDDEK